MRRAQAIRCCALLHSTQGRDSIETRRPEAMQRTGRTQRKERPELLGRKGRKPHATEGKAGSRTQRKERPEAARLPRSSAAAPCTVIHTASAAPRNSSARSSTLAASLQAPPSPPPSSDVSSSAAAAAAPCSSTWKGPRTLPASGLAPARRSMRAATWLPCRRRATTAVELSGQHRRLESHAKPQAKPPGGPGGSQLQEHIIGNCTQQSV